MFDRHLHPASRSKPASRSTWIKGEIHKVSIDSILYSETQRASRSVTKTITLTQTSEFNLVISDLHGLTELLTRPASRQTRCYGIDVLPKLIAPLAPAFAEECWAGRQWDATIYRNDTPSQLWDVKARRQLTKACKGTIFAPNYPIPETALSIPER